AFLHRQRAKETSMFELLLALGLSTSHGAPTPARHFTAILKPDATAPESFAGANGVADIRMRRGKLDYNVTIADLNHVTHVVLLDRNRAVELYRGTGSRRRTLHEAGTIARSHVAGLSMSRLLADARAGKVQVSVFTTSEPGGVMHG